MHEDALIFALDALRDNTILSKSEIIINTTPLLMYCLNCRNEYAGAPDDLICPGCMKANFDIKQGQELLVKAIHGEKRAEKKSDR